VSLPRFSVDSSAVAVDAARESVLSGIPPETLIDLRRVYASDWGRDALRWKGASRVGVRVSVEEIFAALEEIACDRGRELALELAEMLRHSRGVTDSRNFMRPIEPRDLFEIAGKWEANRKRVADAPARFATRPRLLGPLDDVLVRWWTYLDYFEAGRDLTGRADADAYEGVCAEAVRLAADRFPGSPPDRVRSELEREAHEAFEKADFIAFGLLGALTRTSWSDLADRLATGDWDRVLRMAALARLFGEGRFHRVLAVALSVVPEDLRLAFVRCRDALVEASWRGYRTRRDPDEVDFDALASLLCRFRELALPVRTPDGFDFDRASMKDRQAPLRQAEAHLEAVEAGYSRDGGLVREGDPVEAYERATMGFLERIATASSREELAAALAALRQALVYARSLADTIPHRFVYWTGAGEGIGQMISRSHDGRYRLYQLEAYAERIHFAATQVYRSEAALSSLKSELDRQLRSEPALLVQRWIVEYGPRRPVLFGYPPPVSVDENSATLDRDAWVSRARRRLFALGCDPELWGAVASGYTERLRLLLRDGDAGHEPVRRALERLLDEGNAPAFEKAVREANPYSRAGDPASGPCPYVTVGVHVHNADADEIFETLVSMRELEWPSECRWLVLASTSSDPDIACREHELALELGITRFAMTNRQLLKAGNQNRVIPNVPRRHDGESFYLTLDDDNRPAAMTLKRMVPVLLRYPHVSYAQAPTHYRAGHEIGHTLARRADAYSLAVWGSFWTPAFNDLNAPDERGFEASERRTRASISFPLGSGTLFRTTPGRCMLDATGGMVVDPDRMLATEDLATGLWSTHMRARPETFEVIQAEWTGGVFLSEVWVIGDSVDFAPGHHRQKRRWAEGGIQCLHHYWLGVLATRPWTKGLDWKVAVGTTVMLTVWWLTVVAGTFMWIVFPTLALVPWPFTANSVPVLFGAVFYFVLPLCLDVYLERAVGLTFRDVANRFALGYYGTYIPAVQGLLSACFRKPSAGWAAFKRRGRTRAVFGVYLGLGLLSAVGGCVGILRGEPIFALGFVHAAMFFYLWRFREHAASTPIEKVRMLARDARPSFAERLSTPKRALPGVLPVPRYARALWVIWVLAGCAVFWAISLSAAVAVTSALPLVAIAVGSLAQFYRIFSRIVTLWFAIRSIKAGEFDQERDPKEAERLAEVIRGAAVRP
jgi:cellulose synthase/poly-beta-1,6-N-acetylglucosamine synthase-like glycosyltransferase